MPDKGRNALRGKVQDDPFVIRLRRDLQNVVFPRGDHKKRIAGKFIGGIFYEKSTFALNDIQDLISFVLMIEKIIFIHLLRKDMHICDFRKRNGIEHIFSITYNGINCNIFKQILLLIVIYSYIIIKIQKKNEEEHAVHADQIERVCGRGRG